MKQYTITLRGTKKNKTSDITIVVLGDNKNHAFTWAYQFFQKGEFQEPYYASGAKIFTGTERHIPGCLDMMHLKGLYLVPRSSF